MTVAGGRSRQPVNVSRMREQTSRVLNSCVSFRPHAEAHGLGFRVCRQVRRSHKPRHAGLKIPKP